MPQNTNLLSPKDQSNNNNMGNRNSSSVSLQSYHNKSTSPSPSVTSPITNPTSPVVVAAETPPSLSHHNNQRQNENSNNINNDTNDHLQFPNNKVDDDQAPLLGSTSTSAAAASTGDNNNNNDPDDDIVTNINGIKNDNNLYLSPSRNNNDLLDDDATSPASPTNSDNLDGYQHDKPDSPLEHHLRVNVLYRSTILAVFPVFSAYAVFITQQKYIKDKIGITDDDKTASYEFGIAVSCLYIGNLIFRLMHNVIFSFLIPRHRVCVSYILALIAMLTIGIPYWVFNVKKNLVPVVCSYIFGGISIGSFESNILTCFSPLGHRSKSFAVLGLPLGFALVSIGTFVVFWIVPGNDTLHGGVFFVVAGFLLFGLLFFLFALPHVEFEGSRANGVAKFLEELKGWRDWLPLIKLHCTAMILNMFFVSLLSSIVYYVYDDEEIPLWPYAETTIPKNMFQTIFNVMTFCGDFFSRRIAYMDKESRNPFWFLILSAIGGVCVLSKTALLAPLGALTCYSANGLLYAATTKHIDNVVDDGLILTSLSVFLFSGDIGSVVAAWIVQPIQIFIGPVPTYHYPNMTNSSGNWSFPNVF